MFECVRVCVSEAETDNDNMRLCGDWPFSVCVCCTSIFARGCVCVHVRGRRECKLDVKQESMYVSKAAV